MSIVDDGDREDRIQFTEAAAIPVALVIHCPVCGTQHIDKGEWIKKRHKSHLCESCGCIWRPAMVATVGVEYLNRGYGESDSWHPGKTILKDFTEMVVGRYSVADRKVVALKRCLRNLSKTISDCEEAITALSKELDK